MPAAALKPTDTRPKKWLVRLWEIPRDAPRKTKPTQAKSFYVDAPTMAKAGEAVTHELVTVRKRVVRSIGWNSDKSLSAIVFTNEVRRDSAPDKRAQRREIRKAQRWRLAARDPAYDESNDDREVRKAERVRAISTSRKKLAEYRGLDRVEVAYRRNVHRVRAAEQRVSARRDAMKFTKKSTTES